MEGGQAPQRGESGTPSVVLGTPWEDAGTQGDVLGTPGRVRDPKEGAWLLGVGSDGDPKAAGCSDPMGEGGGSSRPPGLGAMAEQDWELEPGWLLSPAGRPYLDSILHKNQRRAFGECPPAPPSTGCQPPSITLSPLPRSAGAPGAAARPGCPHGHLQTLPGGTERRREDGAGGLAGGDPRAPRPPRDPGYVRGGTPVPPAHPRPWVHPGGVPGGDGPACPRRDRGHHAVLAGQAPRQRPPRPVPAAPLGLRRRSAPEVRASAARERGTRFGVGDTSRTPR